MDSDLHRAPTVRTRAIVLLSVLVVACSSEATTPSGVDAGVDAGGDAVAALGVCPATKPDTTPDPGGSPPTCSAEYGCLYGTTCCSCATSYSCGDPHLAVGCFDLANQPAGCPASPPTAKTACGANIECHYCDARGLVQAVCNTTWSVGYQGVACAGR